MMNSRALFLASLVLVTVAGSEPLAGGAKPAPPVSFAAGAGDTVRLGDFKGKVVLLDFWASWCVPCKTSFPMLDSLSKELGPRGLEVLAVNVDERRRDADAFLATRPHTMRVLFDPKGEAALAFDLQGMPSSILIDRRGAIRFTHMGYTDGTLKQYRDEIGLLLGEH